MNKSELIKAVQKKCENDKLTKAATERAIDAVFDTITETVASGDKVQLIGFGTFASVERAARTGRNPQTGKALKIAAKKAPKFTAGKAFKDAVNQ